MTHLTLVLLAITTLAATPAAQNFGGGAKAPNGKFVKFDLESWIPGTGSRLVFTDAPASTRSYIMVLSAAVSSTAIPGFHGTLLADISGGRGFFVYGGPSTPIRIPASFAGQRVIIQGCVIDRNGQGYFTDATQVEVFNPIVMVGNSRQSSNSIHVIDLPTRTRTQTLTNSELGRITFSRDRKWAYVTEPGLRRNRVVVYDLTGRTIQRKAFIPVSGGIRLRSAASRTGLLLYVPIHNGISVIDTNPKSANFHKEIRVIRVPITGTSGAIFTGPMSVVLNRAETKLYIAYGERLVFPAKSTLGVIDLTKAGQPHRAIKISTGGSFIGLATRMDLVVSPDGIYVYALEWGVQPGLGGAQFTLGFKNGGLLSIVNTLTDTEVKAIPTLGIAGQQLCVDRAGRNVWIAQVNLQMRGELLRVDVDNRSSKQFSIRSRIVVGANVFAASSSGPMGIGTTPDGSTVCFTVTEGRGQSRPEMWTLNARTEKLFGRPIQVASLPGTLSISQY